MQSPTASALNNDLMRKHPRSASVQPGSDARSDAALIVHDSVEIDAYLELLNANTGVDRAPYCQSSSDVLHGYAWDPTPRAPTSYQTEALTLFGDHKAAKPAGLLSLPNVYASLDASHAWSRSNDSSTHTTPVSSDACEFGQQLQHNKRCKLEVQVLANNSSFIHILS